MSKRLSPPYLENIEESAEYIFAISGFNYVDQVSYVSYFEAFNIFGKRLFGKFYSGREFFAQKVCEHQEAFKEAYKMNYRLFWDDNDESSAYSRASVVCQYLEGSLRSGKINAIAYNHFTGKSKALGSDFWGSHRSIGSRITGRLSLPEYKGSDAPGKNLLVILPVKELKQALKGLSRNKVKGRSRPSKKSVKQAILVLERCCKEKGNVLNRDHFAAGLNHLLNTDRFKPTSIRELWADFPHKNAPGYKQPKFLDYKKIKPLLDA